MAPTWTLPALMSSTPLLSTPLLSTPLLSTLLLSVLFSSRLMTYSSPAAASVTTETAATKTVINLDVQREAYLAAIDALENNDMAQFEMLKKGLTSYPLYPYLEYRNLLPELETIPAKKVIAFEKQYQTLPFTNHVRSQYLHHLADKGYWRTFVQYQDFVPSSQVHKCNYYYAHSQAGDKKEALEGAKKLYLSGNSISSACDKLFSLLDDNRMLTDKLIVDRMLLTFEKGNRGLLRYLAKQLSKTKQSLGKQIVNLYAKPETVLEFTQTKQNKTQQQLTELAFKRLARQNTALATQQFDTFAKKYALTEAQQQRLAEYVINRIMSTEDIAQAAWRDKWLQRSTNIGLLERRFRQSLMANDWQDMNIWLSLIPEGQKNKPKWRYWRARMLLNQGDSQAGKTMLRSILGQRDFYSVAAAMILNEPISIPFQQTEVNYKILTMFEEELARISELQIINKISESQNEWQAILRRATQSQKAMLAAYALDKSWYSHSVQATISGKLWSHLEYRFPVAHRWFFDHFSKERDLPITTLLALSRQESAFYTSAVSPVGARGLMQLMPATAKETSSMLGVNYLGVETLSDPGINIRIGSGYLRMLLDKFEQNRILAFAAYNAGPHRVTQWLGRSQGNLDVIAFIESIPFRETRGYVQNVLMYEVYYRKLLGMPLQFLYEGELAYNY